jgi:hypothetical protein
MALHPCDGPGLLFFIHEILASVCGLNLGLHDSILAKYDRNPAVTSFLSIRLAIHFVNGKPAVYGLDVEQFICGRSESARRFDQSMCKVVPVLRVLSGSDVNQ